jgi:glycosyltransferase involved in cell wall biosynthesis
MNRQALREGLDYILQSSVFYARGAWTAAGGLNPALRYCTDWDLLIRVTERHRAVLINEFLTTSRDRPEAKLATGGLRRAFEIYDMVTSHTGRPITTGSIVHLLEALLQPGAKDDIPPDLSRAIGRASESARSLLAKLAENTDGFPFSCDDGDATFVQIPPLELDDRRPDPSPPPGISIVVPCFNHAAYLERTLASIISQNYPTVEVIVVDGGSTDGSVDIIKKYEKHLAYWVSERDDGPAEAINKGFARATGEILAWLNSDDTYAAGALWAVARFFQQRPRTEMAIGNALYIDANDQPKVMDHGYQKTALYYGSAQPPERVPAYWSYVHSIPQPSTFFRRTLLTRAGELNVKYKYIFDFELFFRFVALIAPAKIERTLSFYRIHADAKTSDWNKFRIELYWFSRPLWGRPGYPQFRKTVKDFTRAYMARVWQGRQHGAKFKCASVIVAAIAALRLGNPETLHTRVRAFDRGLARRSWRPRPLRRLIARLSGE